MNLSTLAPLLPLATPLIVGALSSGLAEVAKRTPAIPFQGKSAATSRFLVAVLSLGLSCLAAYAEGRAASLDFAVIAQVLVEATIAFVAAIATHDVASPRTAAEVVAVEVATP